MRKENWIRLSLGIAASALMAACDHPSPPEASPFTTHDALVGTRAPVLRAHARDGTMIDTSPQADAYWLIYFYPHDGSKGCSDEAAALRDHYAELGARHVHVLGVSTDDDASHARFTAMQELPFPLLSDPNGAIAASMGVPLASGRAQRESILVGPDGLIRGVLRNVDVRTHVESVLASLPKGT